MGCIFWKAWTFIEHHLQVIEADNLTMPDQQLIANLIALVAVVVAFVAYTRGRKTESKTLEHGEEGAKLAKLQREILEKEEAEKNRVVVSAFRYNTAKGGHRISVINNGRRPALNVNFVFLEDERIVTSLVMDDFHEKFPVKCLIPLEEQTFLIVPCQDTGVSWRYRLTWADEEGRSYECEGKISIG